MSERGGRSRTAAAQSSFLWSGASAGKNKRPFSESGRRCAIRVRALLITTAIVSSVLGAIVVYLVLTVPNDVQANALLKQAKGDLAAGQTDHARDSLSKIVQQYPRTDAAAAATVALVKIGDEQRSRLQHDLDTLRRDRDKQSAAISQLQQTVEDVKNAPPKTIVVQAPAKAPPKARSHRVHHTRHRTRRRH